MTDEGRIARVARALCGADGNDPDVMIEVGGEVTDVGDVTWHREAMAPA